MKLLTIALLVTVTPALGSYLEVDSASVLVGGDPASNGFTGSIGSIAVTVTYSGECLRAIRPRRKWGQCFPA